MYLSMFRQRSRVLASGLSLCLLVAVGVACSVSNGPSQTASQPGPSCPSFPVPQGPLAMKGSFAYAVNTKSHKISWYRIEGTGALTKQGEVDADFQPTFLAAHRTKNFVYATAFCSDGVLAYTINTGTGALTPVPGSPFKAGEGPASVSVDSVHDFAYVANFDSDTVSVYKIGSNGALTLVETKATGGGPNAIGINSAGTLAYVANFRSDTVTAYTINATTGELEATVPNSIFVAGAGPNAIAIHPTGSFLYVTNEESNSVSAYRMNSTTGELAPLSGSPYPTGSGPEGVTVDPTGKFAYVADGQADTVSPYTIDTTTGVLTPGLTKFPGGGDPEGITIDPTGKFVYTVNRDTRDVSAYSISDAITGALTLLSHIPL